MRHLWIPLLLAAGCTTFTSEDDVGYACFDGTLNDGAWTPEVDSPCASGSWEDVELTCGATLDGTTITISSVFSYRSGPSQTDDCQLFTQRCEPLDLQPGTYTVRFRDEEVTVEIGTATPAEETCLPEGSWRGDFE